MVFCTKCGSAMKDTAKFCGECGTKPPTQVAPAVVVDTVQATPKPVVTTNTVHTTDEAAPEYSKKQRAAFNAHKQETGPSGYGYQSGQGGPASSEIVYHQTANLSDPSLKSAWKTVTEKKAVNTWVCFGFTSDSKSDKLVAVSEGKGLKPLKLFLSKNQSKVLFGGIKVVGIDKNMGGLKAEKLKYVYFSFCGSAVPEMVRAQLSFVKRKVQEFFGSTSLTLDLLGHSFGDHVSYNNIGFLLYSSGGSHKSSHFQFGDFELDCKTLQAQDDASESESEMSDY